MSSFYNYNAHQHAATNAHPSTSSHHSSRGRRAPRLSQNSHKQFRGVRKEEDTVVVTTFRQRFESSRSFDLDDDLEFCPALLTESDLVSIGSGSDRSSLSSESPESSPSAVHTSPNTDFHLNSNSAPYIPSASQQSQPTTLKLHQPVAGRIRAIPIVNPNTGLSSPRGSVSPQNLGRRW